MKIKTQKTYKSWWSSPFCINYLFFVSHNMPLPLYKGRHLRTKMHFTYLRQFLHQVVEPTVLLPQQGRGWEAHVLKEEFRSILWKDACGSLKKTECPIHADHVFHLGRTQLVLPPWRYEIMVPLFHSYVSCCVTYIIKLMLSSSDPLTTASSFQVIPPTLLSIGIILWCYKFKLDLTNRQRELRTL